MVQRGIRAAALLSAVGLLTACLACAAAAGREAGLVINEVVSDNAGCYQPDGYGSPDWIELYNDSDAEIRLSDYILTDSTTDVAKINALPDVTMPAHGYLVLLANKQLTPSGEVVCLSFGLSSTGDTLYLLNGQNELVCQLAVPPLAADVSYARAEDGTYGFCPLPTAGQANDTTLFPTLSAVLEHMQQKSGASGGLYISEVVSRNTSAYTCPVCGGVSEWVELYNGSDVDMDLDGFSITDRETGSLLHNLRGVTVSAGEYLVVCCGKSASEAGHAGVSLRIGSDGDLLLLFDASGLPVAELAVPALLRDTSYARKPDGSYGICGRPTPGAANDTGIANPDAATPMDAQDPVRLNEALPDNAYSIVCRDGMRYDWVELYNSSGEATPLGGYYLSDDPNEPLKYRLPDVTLEAHAYLVIFLSGLSDTEAEYHASFSLSANETLTLYDTATDRVDTLPIPTLRPNVSIGRDADGGIRYYAQPSPYAANLYGFADADAIGYFSPGTVIFSEVSAAQVQDTNESDWIELYNGGTADADLSGWYLSDDADEPQKWRIGQLTVPAGGYAVLRADASAADETTVGFGVSAQGETLFLYDAAGQPVDAFTTGVMRLGVTAGRKETDPQTERAFFTQATPGKPNADAALGYAPAPVLSESGLYQSEAFCLTVTCPDPDARIHYTLDGSAPGASSPLYTEPLRIEGDCVVRAVSVTDGLLCSDAVTRTYLFGQAHTLPVVCVAMDPKSVRYIDSRLLNDKPELIDSPGTFCYYETDGTLGISFSAWFKPKGNFSMSHPQKSIRVKLSAALGTDTVYYPFWEGYTLPIENLVLRASGQDKERARLRDSFSQRAMAGLNVDAAQTRPVAVYVNGAYYGLYDLNENYRASYLEAHYGVDKKSVSIVQKNDLVEYGTDADFQRVREFARSKDFSDDAVLEEFAQYVDIDHMTDYLITQIYFTNQDIGNQKYWATSDYAVKWRAMPFDMDRCLQAGDLEINLMPLFFNPSGHTNRTGFVLQMDLFCALRQNSGWCDRFVERYVALVCTAFAPERLCAILDGLAAEMRPEMPRHIARWGLPTSMEVWEENVQLLRDNILLRPAVALGQLQRTFGVSDRTMQELIAKYTP